MQRGVSIRLVDDMPDGIWGRTDGVSIVYLARDLLDFEARSVLAHELIHIERGHTRSQPPEVEHEVTKEAARRLITPADLEQALSLYSDRKQIAAHLLVIEDVLKHVLPTTAVAG
ncbi:ImmA/IrrE family metallo-endopeptidase [uncultured Arthrobacter sp.]|uniref:ImmA/IrrE family metallo-endopeptidase n=1 Tax=uncultured Arthrobacter sp. TaxID=114050 RepID=UPI002618A564|nr:ImmA/IrrE family metallo-endopeptidase [uncultured Arthrobacter sp.]